MLDRPRQKTNFSTPLMLLALSAAGLVISFGLCGLAAFSKSNQSILYAGLAWLGISLIGFLVACVWLVVMLILYFGRN
jgi:hypothetical protein